MRRVDVLGVPVSWVTVEGLLAFIQTRVVEQRTSTILYANGDTVNQAQRNPGLREALGQADAVCADGMGVVWAARLLGEPLPERVNIGDLMSPLFRLAAARGYRCFFLGSPLGVAAQAAAVLAARHPGLVVVGAESGYFTPAEEPALRQRIQAARPDVLLVGMGTPQQERWIARHREALGVPIICAVGAALAYEAGSFPRAPVWMRRVGLEWLFRLGCEPQRLWRRYLLGHPQFLWHLASTLLSRRWHPPVVLVGAGALADQAYAELTAGGRRGALVEWINGDRCHGRASEAVARCAARVRELAQRRAFREVLIAHDSWSLHESLDLLPALRDTAAGLRVLLPQTQAPGSRPAFSRLGTLPAFAVPPEIPRPAYEASKRVFDAGVAGAILLCLLPLLALLWILVRLDLKGLAIFTQWRIGRGGTPFRMYKFRTMFADVAAYEAAPNDLTDPRVTRLGRLLRRWSLDELPQLFNVLWGDMSLVGPRPEMAFWVEQYRPWQHLRHSVRPGLTGLWQVSGRKHLPLFQHLEYDLYYVRQRSWRLDAVILLRTLPTVISRRGAF